jgi:hypothetical protein
MRTRFITVVLLVIASMGCGSGGQAGPTTEGTVPAGGTAAPGPGGGGAQGFCEAAARLELADASNRQDIQAGLEAATPAGQEKSVAVVREFMERQARGDDPYKDPTFLLEYDSAVRDIWEHCGTD